MRVLLTTLALAGCCYAQAPRIQNAKLTTREVPSGLGAQFNSITASQKETAWIGYRIPHAPRVHGETSEWGCSLEDGRTTVVVRDQNTPVPLEGPSTLLLLFRISEGKVERIRTLSPDCLLDAGGLSFFWLDRVNPAESVGLLEGMLKDPNRSPSSIVYAIASTKDPAADAALKRFVDPSQPEAVRRSAVNWLVELNDGVPLTINLAQKDKDAKIRRAAVNALARSKDPRALKFFEETLSK
jgi:hypothetical protein